MGDDETTQPSPTLAEGMKSDLTGFRESGSPRRHGAVRKGRGITGSGVAKVSPHLSGRLTLGMLNKMKTARQNDEQFYDKDNELTKVKELLRKQEELDQKKLQLKKYIDKYTPIEFNKHLRNIRNEKQEHKKELI